MLACVTLAIALNDRIDIVLAMLRIRVLYLCWYCLLWLRAHSYVTQGILVHARHVVTHCMTTTVSASSNSCLNKKTIASCYRLYYYLFFIECLPLTGSL